MQQVAQSYYHQVQETREELERSTTAVSAWRSRVKGAEHAATISRRERDESRVLLRTQTEYAKHLEAVLGRHKDTIQTLKAELRIRGGRTRASGSRKTVSYTVVGGHKVRGSLSHGKRVSVYFGREPNRFLKRFPD